MSKISQTIDRAITNRLVKKDRLRSQLHKSSGKLSASILYYPTLWQVLHTTGIKREEMEPYVLRKFARGNHVEAWLVNQIPGLIQEQKFLEYRDAIGYADTIVDTADYDFKNGIVPNEIKSVTNAKFKWMIKKKGPDESHILQVIFYALAMESKHALLTYVASDDYQIKCFVLDTADYKAQVDKIIDDYQQAMKDWKEKKVLPAFKSRAKWQENPKYSAYPAFNGLNAKEAVEMMEQIKSTQLEIEEVKK